MDNDQGPRVVVIRDIHMSFWSMVVFMVKWAIASIPALMILAAIAGGTLSVFRIWADMSEASRERTTASEAARRRALFADESRMRSAEAAASEAAVSTFCAHPSTAFLSEWSGDLGFDSDCVSQNEDAYMNWARSWCESTAQMPRRDMNDLWAGWAQEERRLCP